MPPWHILACALCALAGCSAPDYTAVRDWARTAGIAADLPGPLRCAAPMVPDQAAGILAMQSALAVYLSSLAELASDGVLPYREDPLAALAPRAAAADADGARAVAALGAFLRHAGRTNMRAPEMRQAIGSADPAVQALVSSLSAALGRACAAEEGTVTDPAHARPDGAPLPGSPCGAGTPAGEAPGGGALGCVGAGAAHAAMLADIAGDHAFLKTNAASITQAETQRRIRAAEDRLRRAILRLHRRRAGPRAPARRSVRRSHAPLRPC